MIEEKDPKSYKKVYSFFMTGLKKSISPSIKSSQTIKQIKKRTSDVYSCIQDVVLIFISAIDIVFQCILSMFKITKNIPQTLKKAAKNNFKLGLKALNTNNLIDARIRFLLSNMFYNKSAKTKYYIAYIYYRQRFFSKSLKYLQQSISIDSKNKQTIMLLNEIENEIKTK